MSAACDFCRDDEDLAAHAERDNPGVRECGVTRYGADNDSFNLKLLLCFVCENALRDRDFSQLKDGIARGLGRVHLILMGEKP